jgi:RNA polymerase sigma-70 factor (ECF subfamily)
MWPNQDETVELLGKAKTGDGAAINQLMDRHRDSLRYLVQMRLDRKIQRRIDVSDVVQEVLVEANRRLMDFIENPSMSFRLWLRQIAKDRIIDAHRRHRGSARRSVDREQVIVNPMPGDVSSVQLASLLSDQQLTPAAQVLQKEMAERVEQAILKLEENDAEIILMRNYEHLTNQEVSQALSITEAAASMRYLRALRRLKAVLQSDSTDSAASR